MTKPMAVTANFLPLSLPAAPPPPTQTKLVHITDTTTPMALSGQSQPLTFTFTDDAGAADIISAQVEIVSASATASSGPLSLPASIPVCYFGIYNVGGSASLYLVSNTPGSPGFAASWTSLSNANCALSNFSSSQSGNTLTFSLSIQLNTTGIGSDPKTIFAGAFNALQLTDATNGRAATSGWANVGLWNVSTGMITGVYGSAGSVGSIVTINGAGFGDSQGASTITCDCGPVTVLSWSDSSIVAQVPNGTTAANFAVTVGGVLSQIRTAFTNLPHITSYSPASATIGSAVVISGQNFGSCTLPNPSCTVTINGRTTSPVTWTDQSILVQVPAGAASSGVLFVTALQAPSNSVKFTVRPTITSVTILGPDGTLQTSARVGFDTVSISGSNFGTTKGTVTLNGALASGNYIIWSDTAIRVYVVPCNSANGNGSIVVNRPDTYSSDPTPFTVAAEPTGVIGTPIKLSQGAADSRHHLQIVFLGDGYTNTQVTDPKYGTYDADIRTVYNTLFTDDFLNTYRSYFDVYEIQVASAQCGASHLDVTPNTVVNNYLGSQFPPWPGLSTPTRLLTASSDTVTRLVNGSLGSALPSGRWIAVHVNDMQYGASGGIVAVVSKGATDRLAHEIGHSVGTLLDEYVAPPGSNPPAVCDTRLTGLNVTNTTSSCTLDKWSVWIDSTTPCPSGVTTPALPSLYEGAKNCSAGLYRPTYNSKMRDSSQKWDQVNLEQMVYRTYLGITEFPTRQATTTISKLVGETASFPAPGVPDGSIPTLQYSWSVDGSLVPGKSGQGPNFSTLDLDTSSYSVGSHAVTVKVQDSLIKDPGLQGVFATGTNPVTWTLQLGACEENYVPQYNYLYESHLAQGTFNGQSALIPQDRQDTDEIDYYYTCTGAYDHSVDRGIISSTPWVECTYSSSDWLDEPYPCGEDDDCTCTPHNYEYEFSCQDGQTYPETVTVTEQVCTIIIGSGAAIPAVERKRKEK